MSSRRRLLSSVQSSFTTALGAALAIAGWAAAVAVPPTFAQATDELEEIVVRVRQREETVRDVPGTVSVLSEQALEASGVERARDFIALTPGVSIVNAAEVADSQVNIRGINGARDAETNYALIIDGILMTNPAALNREYTNLQQVEVLKGPQGAIYGRNAAAGAFVITTKKPGEEFGGDVKASYAEDDTYVVAADIGGPLTDTLKFGLGGNYRDTDGYYSNKDTGSAFPAALYDSGCDDCVDYFEDWAVTGRLLWEPTDALSVDTKVRYGEVDAASITFNSVFHLPVPAQFGFGEAFYEDVNEHEFGFNPNLIPFNDQDSLEISAKMDYDLGWADLTAWGLYSDIDNSFGADGTSGAFGFFWSDQRCQDTTVALQGFPVNPPQVIGDNPFPPSAANPTGSLYGAYTPTSCDGTQYQVRNQEDYSFELRLASKSDQRLRWLAGLYYLNIDREVGVNLGLDAGVDPTDTLSAGIILESLYTTDARNPTQQLVHDQFDTDVYAVFGQLAYDLTEDIEASLALRYDREERDVQNLVPTGATTTFIDTCLDGPDADPINPGLCATGSIADQSEDFDQVEPKFALTWDATDALTAYASVGVGFKSGGFNSQGSAATVDGFINDLVVAPNPGVCGANSPCTPVNIEDSYKEETSLSYEVGAKSEWLDNRLRAELSYYHTDVDDMQFFEFFVGPFGLLRVVSNIDDVSIDGVELDVSWAVADWLDLYAGGNWIDTEIEKNNARPDTEGNDSPYTPDWTASGGARMTWPLSESFDFIAGLDVTAIGDTWFHAVQDQARPTLFTGLGFGPGEYTVAQRDAYTLINGRIGVAGERWTLVAFARNLFDEEYVEEVIPAPEFGGSFIHAGTQSRIGVEWTYGF